MNIYVKQLLIILIFTSLVYSQSDDFIRFNSIESQKLKGYFTNDGRLAWDYSNKDRPNGIFWPKENPMALVFEHGLWIFGIRNDTLIGVAPWYDYKNYTPGPIIDNQAAVIVAPEDSSLYRSYKLTPSSGPGDPDYDEWPVQWGAPTYSDESPKLLGDMMLWTVYNDAHPDVHGFMESRNDNARYNMNIEVRETIWTFNRSGYLGDAMFFKWQIFNKGNETLDSVVICHWNDFDLVISNANNPAYDLDRELGYFYNIIPEDYISDYTWPVAASYFMLQGPIVPSPDSTAFAFKRIITDYKNLPTTAFWGIADDAVWWAQFGGQPYSIPHAYNFALGKRHDGSPIINPVTNDTTTFTFTGNPITGEGWLYEGGLGASGGYMISSGPLTMAPRDSQEVIFAMVGALGDSLEEGIENLFKKVDRIRRYYDGSLEISDRTNIIPDKLILYQNYPNPFNPQTTIEFSIPRSGIVMLTVYDILGREVETILNKHIQPGHHTLQWNASDVPSGIYFIRMQSGGFCQVRKAVVVR